MKILVVDDSEAILDILKINLSSSGHEITCALDGSQGLQKASSHSFDLIVSDINMPIMDGISFGLELRKTNQTTQIIYFSSIMTSKELQEKFEQIGNTRQILDKNLKELYKMITALQIRNT